MYLDQLSVINFKNYPELDVFFSPEVNVIVGDNGEGKTNLLDAIFYLSFCKSFLNPIDSQNIRHNEKFFVVQGKFKRDKKNVNIYCGVKRGKKKQFKKNKKAYERLADHIGLLPLVVISPADMSLVSDVSEMRRKFMDGIICQIDKEYLNLLMAYNKVLSQRNALLKMFYKKNYFRHEELEVWDMLLVQHGQKIHDLREKFIENFIPVFQKHYNHISKGKEEVSLKYSSQLQKGNFWELLTDAVGKDRMVQYSTVGTHKDDLHFNMDGYLIKKYGSQGQQKSFLLALKLAEFDYLKARSETTPMLLMDDICDKLDSKRISTLLELTCNGEFGQVFITDTNKERIERLLGEHNIECKLFSIEEDKIKEN